MSLSDVNKLEYSELRSYKIALGKQTIYKNRFQYSDLVKKCLDGEINCYEFQWDFVEIHRNDMKINEKFIDKVSRFGINSKISFQTDSKIENFCSLLGYQIVPMCEFLDDDLSEKSFYHELEQVYSEMLKYIEDPSVIQNDSEMLKFVVIFFTVVSCFAYSVLNTTIFNLVWQSTTI